MRLIVIILLAMAGFAVEPAVEIELPFPPVRCWIDQSGSTMLASSAPIQSETDPARPLAQLARINLANATIESTTTISDNPLVYCADSEHAYISLSSAPILLVLDKNLKEKRRIFLSSTRVRNLASLAERLYIFSGGEDIGVVSESIELAVPELSLINRKMAGRDTPVSLGPRWSNGVWMLDGEYLTADGKSRVGYFTPPYGLMLRQQSDRWSIANMSPSSRIDGLFPWSRKSDDRDWQQNGLMSSTESDYCLQSIDGTIPIRLSVSSGPYEDGSRMEVIIKALRLIDNAHCGSWAAIRPVRDDMFDRSKPMILSRGEFTIIIACGRIIKIRTSDFVRDSITPPMAVGIQPHVTLAQDTDFSIPMPIVHHAKRPITATLLSHVPGARIAGDSICFTAKELIAWIIGIQVQSQSTRDGIPSSQLEQIRTLVHRWTGQTSKGIPVWVEIRVEILDADLQRVEFPVSFFVDVPEKR